MSAYCHYGNKQICDPSSNLLGNQHMNAASEFMNQFDEDGRYAPSGAPADGTVSVIFLTTDSRKFDGRLLFKKGLCVRAEMNEGGDWSLPQDSPIMGTHFLLHFDGEAPHGILINQGRVVQQYDKGSRKG